jgi:flavin-dependent dehydrogenase
MPDHFDVVIIGGGPAGSATAINLARLGHKVALTDRATFPRDKCCSEYGSPATVSELHALGVTPGRSSNPPTALRGTAVTAHGGNRLEGRFARAGGPPGTDRGMALRRQLIDAQLLDAARKAGVTVREGCRFRQALRNTDGIHTVTCEHSGESLNLSGRVLVGADGIRSRVARTAGLSSHGSLARLAFVAHVNQVSGLNDTAELHVNRTGYVGLNPLDVDTANVALVVPVSEAQSAAGNAEGFFWDRLQDFPAVRDRIDRRQQIRRVLVSGPFDSRARSSVGDGLLLVGDAADFFDPFTGEGIWSALVGGSMAAGVIHGALNSGDPIGRTQLNRYRTLRRRRFAGKWLIERVIGHAMRAPALFDRAVARLERRGLADTLIGVTGDFIPASKVLNPWFLIRTIA